MQAGKKAAADTELGRLQMVVGTAVGSVRAYSAASAKQTWAATGVYEGCEPETIAQCLTPASHACEHVCAAHTCSLLPTPEIMLKCRHRGVAALAYSEGGGSGGLVYSVGADCQVVALEAASGQKALRFKAGNHPLSAAAASPGTPAFGVTHAYMHACKVRPV